MAFRFKVTSAELWQQLADSAVQATFSKSWRFDSATLRLKFSPVLKVLQTIVGPEPDAWLQQPPNILAVVANRVELELNERVGDKSRSTKLNLTGIECAEIIGLARPTEENVRQISRRIRDRSAYARAELGVPQLPDSKIAQGQTKKPGSHSQSRHH